MPRQQKNLALEPARPIATVIKMPGDISKTALLRVAGGLGFSGTMAGFTILILGCCGFDAVMMFSPVPITLGFAGAVISTITFVSRDRVSDSTTLAALFLALLAIAGGLLEAAVWMGWPILFNQRA